MPQTKPTSSNSALQYDPAVITCWEITAWYVLFLFTFLCLVCKVQTIHVRKNVPYPVKIRELIKLMNRIMNADVKIIPDYINKNYVFFLAKMILLDYPPSSANCRPLTFQCSLKKTQLTWCEKQKMFSLVWWKASYKFVICDYLNISS